MKQRFALLILGLFCQVCNCLVAARFFWAVFTAPDKARGILLAYDRLGNVAANGDWKETISARSSRARREGRRWGCVLCKILDWVDTNHCAEAEE